MAHPRTNFNAEFFTLQLKPFLVEARIAPSKYSAALESVLILEPSQKELVADASHITLLDAKEIALKDIDAHSGATIIVCNCVTPIELSLPSSCTLLAFSCDMPHVVNTLMENMATLHSWQQRFHKLQLAFSNLQEICAEVSSMTGQCPTLVVQENGEVIAGYRIGRKSLLAQLTINPLDMAQLIERTKKHRVILQQSPKRGSILYGMQGRVQEGSTVALIVERGATMEPIDMEAILSMAMDLISSRSLVSKNDRLATSVREFRYCWRDIVTRQATSSADIRQLFNHLPYPVHEFVAIGIISFAPKTHASLPELIVQLQNFFPETNMTMYHHEIIILLSSPERTFRPQIEAQQQLERLLERNHAAMGISNATRKLDGLTSLFSLTFQAMSLKIMSDKNHDKIPSQSDRIIFFEDYSIYTLVDFCVKRYLEAPGYTDPVYLIHPAIVTLMRYDQQHHSGLTDLLNSYLANDRNVAKTSKAMYMHRNTVLNKVNKINELTGIDLENAELRFKLILSCKIADYHKTILGKDILL